MPNVQKPLSGIRVTELSTYVAAPLCGRLLADLGADVIKVEGIKGDPWRVTTAAFRGHFSDEENPIVDLANSGKKIIALDLKQEAGMEAMQRLLAETDVFLTNTRPRSLVKLGLDEKTLRARYPRLIWAGVSGYGDKGPEAESPGFDNAAFWAKSGFLQDMVVQTPTSYPIAAPTGIGDTICGTTLSGAILAALFRRERTGEGDSITISLYNTALWVMAPSIIRAYDRYGPFFPMDRSGCNPFSTFYRCRDGEWLILTILDNRYAPAFYTAIGHPEWAEDERYATQKARWDNCVELIGLLEDIFIKEDSGYWLELLGKNDIVCSRMAHFRDAATSEQAWANDFVETLVSPNGQECVIPRSPIRLASQEIAHTEPAGHTGRDTRSVLTGLGYTEAEIQAMLASQAARAE